MGGFTKLFSSILTSSVWQEDDKTRLLWITMLASADADGRVEAAIPGMAMLARISIAECEHGLEVLLSPDEYSRTTEHEGRRIEAIDGGWLVSNGISAGLHLHAGMWALTVRDTAFLALAVHGWFLWGKHRNS